MISSIIIANTADAHLVSKPKNDSLKAREVSQMENLYHAKYVCRHGKRQHRRWACAAVTWLRRELQETRAALHPTLTATQAIRLVFGSRSGEALHVSWCESHWQTTAQNGQYLGLFQMGDSERRLYGHGPDPLTQARAAHRYFVASGSDWSPWDPKCRP